MFDTLKKLFENTNVNRALVTHTKKGRGKGKKSFGRKDKSERSSFVPKKRILHIVYATIVESMATMQNNVPQRR